MIEMQSRLRRWGRSFGIVIPMEIIKRESLGENDKIDILKNISNDFEESVSLHFPIVSQIRDDLKSNWENSS